MINEPLDESYFKWLYSQVGSTRTKDPSKTYWKLLKQLYKKEFLWFVPNDDNRAADGIELRYEFIDTQGLDDVDPDWFSLGCSFLEMLIGLSRRLSFDADGESRDWFWHLMENLELRRYNDATIIPETKVDRALKDVIFRTYEPDGRGSLFPLKHPNSDQREVEIIYQMNSYLIELDEERAC